MGTRFWLRAARSGLGLALLLAPSDLYANSPRPTPYDEFGRRVAAGTPPAFVPADSPAGLDAPTPRDRAAPTRNVNQCVVLLIQYSGQAGGQTAASFNNMLFTTGSYATGSMNDYYREVSYGLFGVNGTTYPTANPWYAAANNEAYYVNGYGGMLDTYPKNSQGLVREAVIAADATVNFATYDNNGDGYVDNVFVVFVGYAAEAASPANYNDMWSHKWALSGGVNGPGAYLTNDGVRVDLYTVTPELRGTSGTTISAIGVYCHEYGHILGLPDLYDTKPVNWVALYDKSEGVGNYCLMAGGSWGANGSSPDRPAHLCCWAKNYLGWIGNLVTPAADLYSQWVLRVEDNDEAYKLWTGGMPEQEYFLVENRQKYGFDTNFPNCGLLVYHVDETVISGDYDSDGVLNWADNDLQWDEVNKFIDVECADQTLLDHVRNTDHLDATTNRGDGNDFFRANNNATFNAGSRPGSVSYSGAATSVAVQNVSACGSPMTADLLVGNQAGGAADLWIKDCGADNGTVPSTGLCPWWWTSTDIWIDNDKDGVQDAPVLNQNNQLYARIRNAGPNAASNVTVDYYYRDNTTGLGFPAGANYIGTKNISYIASGATVSKWLLWNVPNPPTTGGHWCIGVVASSSVDSPGGGSPPWENDIAPVNIGVLYSRAGTPPLQAGNKTVIALPVEADFRFENPGPAPEMFMLSSENLLPAGWTALFLLEGQPIALPQEIYLMGFQMKRITVQIVPPQTAPHGQEAVVRVIQWHYSGYPSNRQAITGGINFPTRVDLYRPNSVTDLSVTPVFDTANIPPESRPLLLVQWSPVTTDINGTPEYVAYYTIYRDTVYGFTPSPANKVADVALDVDTVMPGLQWYDETAVVRPGVPPGYYYNVLVHDEAGYESESSNYAGVSDVDDGAPTPGMVRNLTIHPNAPNPFSRGTEIRYDLSVAGRVTVSIFSVSGQKVATLVDGEQAAGPQVVPWDARDSQGAAVNSGIYFCHVERAGAIATTKMILLR